jgi:hypothetical protein
MLVEGTFIKVRFTFLLISKQPSNNVNCKEGIYVAIGWMRINFIQGKKSKVLCRSTNSRFKLPSFLSQFQCE